MRTESPHYAYPQTHKYLVAALKDRNRPIERLAQKNVRATNILFLQFGTPAQPKDIGEIYGHITRQRIRAIVKDTIEKVHQNASPQFQRKFNPTEIPLKKPYTARKGENISEAKNGPSFRIKRFVRHHGNTKETIKKMRSRLHLTNYAIANSRDTLKKWGIDIPYLINTPTTYNSLAGKLATTKNLTEIYELFKSVRYWFYHRDLLRPKRLLVPLRETAKDFHFPPHQLFLFARSLEKAKIPLLKLATEVKNGPQKGKRTNHFLARQTEKLAKKILFADPSLARFRQNPVTQICGPENRPIPTTTQIAKSDGLLPIGAILRELGIPSRGKHARSNLQTLLTPNCPVAIFRDQRSTRFYQKDKAKLKKFLKQKSLN